VEAGSFVYRINVGLQSAGDGNWNTLLRDVQALISNVEQRQHKYVENITQAQVNTYKANCFFIKLFEVTSFNVTLNLK
jgi:hypothetical protein